METISEEWGKIFLGGNCAQFPFPLHPLSPSIQFLIPISVKIQLLKWKNHWVGEIKSYLNGFKQNHIFVHSQFHI